MNLYEITNGYMGNSYVRAFAWASSEQEALELARPQFVKQQGSSYSDSYSTDLEVKLLFSADAAPFCTIPDSDGWETPDIQH